MYITVEGSADSFLQPEIIGPVDVLVADTREGTMYMEFSEGDSLQIEHVADSLGISERYLYEYHVNKDWYMARTSAPGYLDCTDWVGFATEEAAMKYLENWYSDD